MKLSNNVLPALLTVSLTLVTQLAFAQKGFFEGANQPTEVMAAHDSFLQGDFNQLAVNIKRALQAFPNDKDIQKDMLKLYDKAYEIKGNSALSPDFKTPIGLQYVGFSFRKRLNANDSVVHRLNVSGEILPGADIELIQVIGPKGDVLIDTVAGIGQPIEGDMSGGHHWFWVGQNSQVSSFEDGLYLLNIKVKDQPIMNGYVIASQMNATESPDVQTPIKDETLTTPTPTFKWQNFVSTQYRNFEKRKVSISVQRNSPEVKDDTWSWENKPAQATQITLGHGMPDSETGALSLPNDNYIFQIRYRESHQFGDIQVGRESATNRNFSVKALK